MRLRAKIQQPDALRMLVVLEQSVGRRGNHARAPGDAGDELYPATLRRARSRAGGLQMAEHAADTRPDSRKHLPSSGRGWSSGHALGHSARHHALVSVKFRAVRWIAGGAWACRRSLATP